MHHILTTEQFDTRQLAELFVQADHFRETDQTISDRRDVMQLRFGRVMLSMFYEPSTRTRFSFGIAVEGTEKGAALTTQASQELELLLHQHLGETTVNMKQYTADTQIIINKLEEVASIYLP